jgi:branched-chain amino acid aminotransferase
MPEPLVFLHGRFLPQSQAALSLHDAGFVMGATVTDLCRTFHHKLYRWPDHVARFGNSCRSTQIEPPLPETTITAKAEELVRHNAALLIAGQELALVMFATPGPIGYYLGEAGGAGDGAVTFGMHTFPLPFARYRRWVSEGAALVTPEVRQVPASSIDPHIKMRSRLHWWLADHEAQRLDPGAAALLLDETGQLTETAAANVLIVKDGRIVSPPRERVLEGISLRVVIELCGKLGIPFEERPLAVPDLLAATEVMLASTPYCLMGVSRCNGARVPWPGQALRRLLATWSDEVGVDIHGQILASRERQRPEDAD